MHQAEQLPLGLHFFLASHAKSVQFFIAADIAEHGFYHGHSVAVDLLALVTVDPVFHPIGVVWFALVFENKRDMSTGPFTVLGSAWVLHALVL